MLPMECQFLNKTALIATTGQQPLPVKHFALKRKPKSATLRAELLQKCKLRVLDCRLDMSRVMRKPAFAFVKNKSAGQLCCNCAAGQHYHAADQCLCFHYIDSTMPLLPNSGISNL